MSLQSSDKVIDDSINQSMISHSTVHRYESQVIQSTWGNPNELEDPFIFVGDGISIAKQSHQNSEDAYFITDIGIGVSDGVGSW